MRYSCSAALVLALAACAPATPTPSAAPVPSRAVAGDTVWIIANPVHADRREQFERFINEFWTLGRRAGQGDPLTLSTFENTRVLYPTQANPDGTYTYFFVMDPRVPGADYSIERLLRRATTQAEADRIYRMYTDATRGPQTSWVLVQPSM